MPSQILSESELKNRAVNMYYFLNLYSKLEKCIKSLFCTLINKPDFDKNIKEKIIFYASGISFGKTIYIDYDTTSLTVSISKYKYTSLINTLTLNQILKIHRNDNCLTFLEFNIDSLERKLTQYKAVDFCIAFVNMRNKLSHELENIVFDERKDIVEKFSREYFQTNREYLNMNSDEITDNNICIYSNYKYMEIIYSKLKELEDCNEKNEKLDKE